MKIIPLVSDSLGVRSFCVFVKTEDTGIIIDPGLDLAPLRYSLPPHRLEIEQFYRMKERIREYILKADTIIITHYHHDHYSPDFISLYKGKRIFLKDFTRNINYMQKKRAQEIYSVIKGFEIADNKNFRIGATEITFSPPLPHGDTPAVVIGVTIKEKNKRLLFTSDISGPIFGNQLDFILGVKPHTLILDGPAIYINMKYLNIFKENLKKIRSFNPEKIIIDHHLTRILNWRDYLPEFRDNLDTFASFRGEEESPLEAMRKKLWEGCQAEGL